MRILSLLSALLAVLLSPVPAGAVDISNPLTLMFVADAKDNVIDVIDLDSRETVFRIETKHPVDDVVVTPFAPVLVYTNIERKLVSLYDLKEQKLAMEVTLPMTPRHMVLDTSGTKIGFSDSQDGGFVLFSAYDGKVMFELADFPPTRDVLFDPNEIDIFYSNSKTGAIGVIDTNLQRTVEMPLTDSPDQMLSAPSRSLDGRYCLRRQRNHRRGLLPQCVLEGRLSHLRNRRGSCSAVYDAGRAVFIHDGQGLGPLRFDRAEPLRTVRRYDHRQGH